VSPRVALKIEQWKRAGLFGARVIREQIVALETYIDRGEWSAEVSADLDELRQMLEESGR
jgi:hypothetical protein